MIVVDDDEGGLREPVTDGSFGRRNDFPNTSRREGKHIGAIIPIRHLPLIPLPESKRAYGILTTSKIRWIKNVDD